MEHIRQPTRYRPKTVLSKVGFIVIRIYWDWYKLTKTRLWLQRINTDENTDPLEVIGFLIKNFMAPPLPEPNRGFLNDNFFDEDFRDDEKPALTEQQEKTIEKIREALTRANFQYIPGVGISHISNSASRSLKEILEKHDYAAINLEFERALKTLNQTHERPFQLLAIYLNHYSEHTLKKKSLNCQQNKIFNQYGKLSETTWV